MTHKQKADELVERFSKHVKAEFIKDIDGGGYDLQQYHIDCIQCAIICVDEILELPIYWCTQELSNANPEGAPPSSTEEYWQSVLNELKSRL